MSWEDILKRNLSSVAHTDISTLNQNDPIVATDPNLTSRPARHLTETRCCVKAKQKWIDLCEKYFGQMIRASNRRTINCIRIEMTEKIYYVVMLLIDLMVMLKEQDQVLIEWSKVH